MRPFASLRRAFRWPTRSTAQVAADVDAELEFHLEQQARDLVAAGWPRDTARAEAERRFGDLAYTRRYCRTQDQGLERRTRAALALGALTDDARFALRQLRRQPGFAAVALLTLALGIGANTAIFSVVHGVLLRPLPFADPGRLVRIAETSRGELNTVSPTNFVDWREQSRSFTGMAAVSNGQAALTGAGEPEQLRYAQATAQLFDVLGVPPLLGRTFAAGDDRWGGPRVVVLNEGLWRRRFGADPGIVGRPVVLDGESYEVIGVVPAEGAYPSTAELWTPLAFDPAELPGMRGAHWLRVLARLRPDVEVAQGAAEMAAIARRLERQYPEKNTAAGTDVAVLHDVMVGDVRTPLLVLLGAVGVVLLIACANVANLLLARAVGREGEIAVRAALGAGRGRIVRQLATESVVLALLGGAAGAAVAVLGVRALVAVTPDGVVPRLDTVRVDGTVLGVTLALAVLVGLLFGLAPVVQGMRLSLDRTLREGGRGTGGSRRAVRAVDVLAGAEIALAVVLVAGAALLIRSFDRLRAVDPGVDVARVVTFDLQLPEARYGELDLQRAFNERLLGELRALPGVQHAGAVFGLPFSGFAYSLSFEVAGRPPVAPGERPSIQIRVATPDYFAAVGIPVRRGRGFGADDRAGAGRVILVNEAAARRFFPGQEPLGQQMSLGWTRDSVRMGGTIVGVVGDVRQFGLAEQPLPEIYVPYAQWPVDFTSIVLRTAGDPDAILAAARERVRQLDPALPLARVTTLERLAADTVAQPRFYMLLLGGFAALALVLAAVGVYGVIAYAVGRRTREIGVRMALGATSRRVLRDVVLRALALGGAGLAVGLVGALAATRLLRSQLYEVAPTDPATFAAVAVLLLLVAVAAAWVPARRASRVSPTAAMRER